MQASKRHTPEELMQLALNEAERGRGRTRPNPVVGCVIAKQGRVIATGYHARAGLPHAEVMALRAAGERARGADAYITLEPCNHTGRTGFCTRALLAAGVTRVVVGMLDPNPLVHKNGVRYLRQHGIDVLVGLLAAACRTQNEAFTHYMHHRRPLVTAKFAASLDGRVATRTGDSQWVTGPQARREGHRLRDGTDAILVGVGTVLADDPALTCRLRGGHDPIRVVVDTNARTPSQAQLVRQARRGAAPTWIVVGTHASVRRCQRLAKAGAEIITCRQRHGRIDFEALLDELGRREILSLLIEGGPTVLGGFFDAGLVNKVHAFIAPRIIGGVAALGAVGGAGCALLAESLRLDRLMVRSAGRDLWVTGYFAGTR